MQQSPSLPPIAHAVVGISDVITPVALDIVRFFVVAPVRFVARTVKRLTRRTDPVTAPHVSLVMVPGTFLTAPFSKR